MIDFPTVVNQSGRPPSHPGILSQAMDSLRFSLRLIPVAAWPLLILFAPLPVQAQWKVPAGAPRPVYSGWSTYLNPLFAFEVPIPPGLRAQSNPRQGPACRFVSGNGTLAIRAWGDALRPEPGDPLEWAWRDAVNLRGRRIDYQRRNRSGFVLSGMNRDGSIFYEKLILGRGATAGVNVSYPASESAAFAPWLAEIDRGFRWHPEAAAVIRNGGVPPPPPARGLFSGPDYAVPPSEPPPGPGWSEWDESSAAQNVAPPPRTRETDANRIDLTPPPPLVLDKLSEKEKDEETSPPPAPRPAKREDLPYGTPIPGKKGYVYSPYDTKKQQVDVSGIPTGTKVKCPYTGKVFRVP